MPRLRNESTPRMLLAIGPLALYNCRAVSLTIRTHTYLLACALLAAAALAGAQTTIEVDASARSEPKKGVKVTDSAVTPRGSNNSSPGWRTAGSS